jgi:hypothetical protein
MLASVSRLSKMDRSSWKYLHRPGTSISGGANAYYYRELEKKLLKFVHPLNLWKKTRGDADKVLKLIKPVFSRKDYQTIVKFLREGKR